MKHIPQISWHRQLSPSVGMMLFLAFVQTAAAQTTTLSVQVDRPTVAISPLFYGMMTEELNHSYDGGLYADLIQNRIFQQIPFVPPNRENRPEATDPGAAPENTAQQTSLNGAPNLLIHWKLVNSEGASGTMALDASNPVNSTALKNSLRLDIGQVGDGQRVGVANEGYWGIPVKPNTEYTASFYIRGSDDFKGPVTVGIESNDGRTTYASGTIAGVGAQWRKHSLTLRTGDVTPATNARFVVSAGHSGSLWLSLVSLMPPTYGKLPFRTDLMEKLMALKPAFLRFPGGAYLAGETTAERWAWKTTIGSAEKRAGHMNTAWDYWASDGMGMHEFLLWCEAMNAEPVLALHTGFVFKRRNLGAGPELDSYVQEGLDAIEYVMGDPSTKWGAERARNGHPKPFTLNYVQIGNEEERGGAATYPERYMAFHDAIKAKYPKLQIISGMQRAAPNMAMPRHPDMVDDHYYFSSIAAALRASRAYDPDQYDRNNPKIMIGEYATRLPRAGDASNMLAACGDAAFLIGLERNADVVIMTTYAPLFINVNPGASKWPVNLIGYDALNSFVSPSYYVQKMFIENRGDVILPSKITDSPKIGAGAEASDAIVANATRINASGDVVIKLVNVLAESRKIQVSLDGIAQIVGDPTVKAISGSPEAINTLNRPDLLAPIRSTIKTSGTSFAYDMPATSVSLVRIKTR